MNYRATKKSIAEYVEWYNGYHCTGAFSTMCQKKKKEIADKNGISVRTLERWLKKYYVIDRKSRYAKYILLECVKSPQGNDAI